LRKSMILGILEELLLSMKSLRLHKTQTEIPVPKILCLGRNYAEHAREMNSSVPMTPIVFMKPSSSIVHDGKDIVRPSYSADLHHEVELVVAIGKSGRFIPAGEAMDHVLGYGIGLDMTLRDVQKAAKAAGLPWFAAKGFHTSAALSDIVRAELIPDPSHLTIRCRVNGVVRQETTTDQMIFSIAETIAYLSTVVELERGDLIYTGTPEGVASVVEGDLIEAELEGFVTTHHHIRFSVL